MWRSFKLTHAVSSTLAAESQAMAVATGTVEWLSLIVSELLDGPFDLRNCCDLTQKRPPIAITDCKSLYDHLNSPSSLKARAMTARWVSTNRMPARWLHKACWRLSHRLVKVLHSVAGVRSFGKTG